MNKTIEKYIQDYLEATIKYSQGLKDPNQSTKTINKYYDLKEKYYKVLYDLGDEGKKAIANLMYHPEPYVRLSAAKHSLSYCEDEAKKVLASFKYDFGNLGMNARVILKEWKKKQRKAQWHYLVEPTPKNITRFGRESLHNIFNLIKIPKNIHVRISKHYSSKINGETVAKRLEEKSYIYQYLYGVKTWIQAMFNRL